ncbi:ribulokinase [Metabacillus herbersteinensis]|uniref:Ribulokinase n=1 Tax=Metabacillus herbersteinensis TaxID=283816 RepID=A0ABV6GI58_9BACI
MESKFVFGIDFGTESARAILVNVETGKTVSSSVSSYKHGVISELLPGNNVSLGPNWALQHPEDYIYCLKETIKKCLIDSNVKNESVIGIGVDFTASTVLPISKSGKPLCLVPEFKENPHSWVKLWKHHAAHKEASQINETAFKMNESFLKRYGGEISEEWMLPKILQVLHEAPEIYEAADKFIEAGDWVVMQLVGTEMRSSCMAGYKGTWSKREGFPNSNYLKALDPALETIVKDKLSKNIYPIGTRAGFLTNAIAEEVGLTENVAVAVGIIDAHAAVIGAGVNEPGKMVMAMGTSICHICMDLKEAFVPGISGVVEDGIIPGYFAYEAGQSAGGDSLAWFIKNAVPSHLLEEAEKVGISIYQLLEEKASHLKPGEHGLIALDWWNGNRSILKDSNLTGTIIGMTLQTKAEEIYRALMESLAFGTRKIVQAFNESGIEIKELYACGGLAEKNKLLMQIFADITQKSVHVVTVPNTSAMGSAVLAAVAAGSNRGGYETIEEAVAKMIKFESEVFQPISENSEIYNEIFLVYDSLYKYFGETSNEMKALLNIKRQKKEINKV